MEIFLLNSGWKNARRSISDLRDRESSWLKDKPANWMLWGFHRHGRRQVDRFRERLEAGEEIWIFVHVTKRDSPVNGTVLEGRVVETVPLPATDRYWPEQDRFGENWPYRFYIEVTRVPPEMVDSIEAPEKWRTYVVPTIDIVRTRAGQLIKMNEIEWRRLKDRISKEKWVSYGGSGPLPVGPEESGPTLSWEESIKKECMAHLTAGRSVILVGAPGVGKTRLAISMCSDICSDYSFCLGNPEWTTFDMIVSSEITPRGGTRKHAGILTHSVAKCWNALGRSGKPHWLVLDEINRFNPDLAFGEAFALLDQGCRTDVPLLPPEKAREVSDLERLCGDSYESAFTDKGFMMPLSYRIVATMNVYDRALLFKLGYALLRRFALVRVSSPFLLPRPPEPRVLEDAVSTIRDYANSLPGFRSQVRNEVKTQLLSHREGIPDFAVLTPQRHRFMSDSYPQYEQMKFSENPDVSVLDLFLGLAAYINEKELVEFGFAQVVDGFKYAITEAVLAGDSFDTIRAADRAFASYFAPQLEVLLPKLRMSRMGIGGDEPKKIVERLDDLQDLLHDLGLRGHSAPFVRGLISGLGVL